MGKNSEQTPMTTRYFFFISAKFLKHYAQLPGTISARHRCPRVFFNRPYFIIIPFFSYSRFKLFFYFHCNTMPYYYCSYILFLLVSYLYLLYLSYILYTRACNRTYFYLFRLRLSVFIFSYFNFGFDYQYLLFQISFLVLNVGFYFYPISIWVINGINEFSKSVFTICFKPYFIFMYQCMLNSNETLYNNNF